MLFNKILHQFKKPMLTHFGIFISYTASEINDSNTLIFVASQIISTMILWLISASANKCFFRCF